MLFYLARRLISLAFVLLAVSMIVFALMHSVPGGPFDTQQAKLPKAARENIERKYGLDKPVWQQYLNYMSHAVRFDFGIPYQQPQTTVAALIGKTWIVTVQVGVMTILVAFSCGIAAGMLAAYHRNSWLDNIVTFGAMLGVTVPNFVVAMWFILFFGVARQWLPTGGWSNSGACLYGNMLCSDWILPVLAYAMAPMAIIARYTRASIVDVIGEDIRAHRSGQGPERSQGHAAPCAAQRADPDGHCAGHRNTQPHHRQHLHREHLPHQWPR